MSSRPWKSILTAVADPTARQQLAVRKAALLAAASGARVTLFHAFSQPFPLPQPLPSSPEAILRAVAKNKRAQLERMAAPLRKKGLRVDCEVAWDFPPAQAIVRRVLAGKPDLVVAGSHRHTRLGRWFLANADWDLIRECPCPVWFVKRDKLRARPLVLSAVDPTHAHAKPSGLDDRLLAAAEAVSAQLSGRTALVYVEDMMRTAPLAVLPALSGLLMAAPAALHAELKVAVGRLAQRHGVPASAALICSGLPAETIPATAAKLGADLLVMGAVSRNGLSQAFIGSTAEAVIDAAACDVLIVKPRGFRTTVPRRAPRLGGRA